MTSKHILVVEDDEETRMDVGEQLEKLGYGVFLASDGTGAIQRMLEHPEIDTIVSDIRMPVFGGDYWLSFLEQFCVKRYRILLATGRHLPVVPEGMQFVKKPYSFAELLEALRRQDSA